MIDVKICEVSLAQQLLVGCTILSVAQQWFGIVCIVRLLWLHHVQALDDVTLATKACNLL
jgi:hypothetical protein